MRSVVVAAFLCTAALCVGAEARLAISANDGKQLQDGEPKTVTPDSVSVLDLSTYPPKVIGDVKMPASMIGSPVAVVVSRDESLAIVASSQKVNPADPLHPADDDKVSVVDLTTPSKPRLLQTVTAGPGATAVSMNKPQNLVLVAAKMDDAIHVFRLAGKTLTHVGRVDLGKGAAPTDVLFTPDDRHAYAITMGAGKVMELAIDGAKVTATGQDLAVGKSSYGAVITPDGRWLINTNVGGALTGTDHTGTLTMVDLKTHRLALTLPVGKTPEHVALSPDGKHIAVVLANGTPYVKSMPNYDQVWGILKVFSVGPGTLTEVAHADSCHWAQGATWSEDGKLILQQCASERQFMVYRFDGKNLTQDKAATIPFESRPGSISTRLSR